MPCMCWYDPPEASKKKVKDLCEQIIAEVRLMNEDGDPIGFRIEDVQELLGHMYYPKSCKEAAKDIK